MLDILPQDCFSLYLLKKAGETVCEALQRIIYRLLFLCKVLILNSTMNINSLSSNNDHGVCTTFVFHAGGFLKVLDVTLPCFVHFRTISAILRHFYLKQWPLLIHFTASRNLLNELNSQALIRQVKKQLFFTASQKKGTLLLCMLFQSLLIYPLTLQYMDHVQKRTTRRGGCIATEFVSTPKEIRAVRTTAR
jgi:hypothetical protein